jgi:hypothetical protein
MAVSISTTTPGSQSVMLERLSMAEDGDYLQFNCHCNNKTMIVVVGEDDVQ